VNNHSEMLDLSYNNEEFWDCDISYEEIVKRITEVKETVKRIDLFGQKALTEIPGVLKECRLLEEIDVGSTLITKIPDFVFTLPNLRSFSCIWSNLSVLPKNIYMAEKLEKLSLRIEKEQAIPLDINELNNLKSLRIDAVKMFSLPEILGELKNLEEFTFYFSLVEEGKLSLPESFANLSSLKDIRITKCNSSKENVILDLDKTVKILTCCPNFESLSLGGIDIGKGYQTLPLLVNLKELALSNIKVKGNIFETISSLHKLQLLCIRGKKSNIGKLPDIFKNLPELQSIHFSGNFVQKLPSSIYSLSKLELLEISGAGITSLDEKIGNLQNLQWLYLHGNMLEALPEAVFSLPLLAFLEISFNNFNKEEITRINEKIKTCTNKEITLHATYKDYDKNGRNVFFENGEEYKEVLTQEEIDSLLTPIDPEEEK